MVTVLPLEPADWSDTPDGMDLLNRQGLNKGTAFTDQEHTELGLHGLLPPHVETLDEQSFAPMELTKEKMTTSSAISTCEPCRTRTRSSSTGLFSTTSKR
jgi:hypothetical protein